MAKKISKHEQAYLKRLAGYSTPPGLAAIELCALRMERTLNGPPKHGKTRAYVATLPKRNKPARVSAEEFQRCKAIVVRQLAEKALVAIEPPIPRKDRLRPRVLLRKVFRAARDLETCRRHRILLFDAQDGLCGGCGNAIEKAEKGSLDHVIPLYHDGPDALHNLLLMHGECNGQKSNEMPSDYVLERNRLKNDRLGLVTP